MLILSLIVTAVAGDVVSASPECVRLGVATVYEREADGNDIRLPDILASAPGLNGVIMTIESNGDGTERLLLHAGSRLQTEGPSCQTVTKTGDTCPSFVGPGDQVLTGCINDGKVSVVYFDGTSWWVGPAFDGVVPGTISFVGGYPLYKAYKGNQTMVVWRDNVTAASH